jgi:hypothetical protein
VLRHKQDFYRIRLEHEPTRTRDPAAQGAAEILAEEEKASIEAIRQLTSTTDAVRERGREFEEKYRPIERESIGMHHRELEDHRALRGVAIAGGHVARS